MTLGRFALTAALFVLVSGCSEQSELREARQRIAQLEAELAAERAKPSPPAVTPAPVNPATTAKPVEPETNRGYRSPVGL